MPSDSSGRPQFHDTIRAGERQALFFIAKLLICLLRRLARISTMLASDECGYPALPLWYTTLSFISYAWQ